MAVIIVGNNGAALKLSLFKRPCIMNLFQINVFMLSIPREEVEKYNYYHAKRARLIDQINKRLRRKNAR